MFEYIFGGLVAGGIVSIMALGLALTHIASRIFNVGHGAIAFAIAMCYYQLQIKLGWSTWAAGAASVLVIAPALGLTLWLLLFRPLADRPASVKLVATIGVYVALPAIVLFVFGNRDILAVPGLAGASPSVNDVLGVRLNTNQIIALVAAAMIAGGLTCLLRLTRFGLMIRSAVDAPAVSEMSGISGTRISVTVWALGSTMAGLAGVLLAPMAGLDATEFSLVLVTSFAAVIVARFRSLLVTFCSSIVIGVLQSLSVGYLPATGMFAGATIRACVPFLVILAILIAFQIRSIDWDDLDSATLGLRRWDRQRKTALSRGGRRLHLLRPLVYLIVSALVVATLASLLSSYWIGILTGAAAIAVVLLSYVLTAGEGGMISMCQITFAGIGGASIGQLVTLLDWQFWPAMLGTCVIGAAVACLFGLILSRLNNLYFALATLGFGLLVDSLAFASERLYQAGAGVPVILPTSLEDPTTLFVVFAMIASILAAAMILLQHSLSGRILAGFRSSPAALETLGVNVALVRLVTFGVAGGIAALGGAMLVSYTQLSLPATQFPALTGLLWFAVLVTLGVRSPLAAIVGGAALQVVPALLNDQLSPRWTELLPALFGLGAVGLAWDPRGVFGALAGTWGGIRTQLIASVRGPSERRVGELADR